jgi:hypothetical protein
MRLHIAMLAAHQQSSSALTSAHQLTLVSQQGRFTTGHSQRLATITCDLVMHGQVLLGQNSGQIHHINWVAGTPHATDSSHITTCSHQLQAEKLQSAVPPSTPQIVPMIPLNHALL